MGVHERNLAVPGDECNCGRRASVLHCPSCGTTRVYSRMHRMHRMIDGTDKLVQVQYRCQTCGHLFIEEERSLCEAPPALPELAKQRARVLAQELLRTNPERAQEIVHGDAGKMLKEEDQIPDEAKLKLTWDESTTTPESRKQMERQVRFYELEWAGLHLNNKAPCGCQEYVTRRMKGESFA